jgi:hypothetical protein
LESDDPAEDDKLIGNGGDDTLNGGDGDDILIGGDDDDTINAGEGNDTIIAGHGDDDIDGGNGTDIYTDRDLNQDNEMTFDYDSSQLEVDVDQQKSGGTDDEDEDMVNVETFNAAGGDDNFLLKDDLLDNLSSVNPFTIDGGAGKDVIQLGATTSNDIDFTAASNPIKPENIEAINTSNSGTSNVITLSTDKILSMTDSNNTLFLNGDSNDTFDLNKTSGFNDFSQNGSDSRDFDLNGDGGPEGKTYDKYVSTNSGGSDVTVYVNNSPTLTGDVP